MQTRKWVSVESNLGHSRTGISNEPPSIGAASPSAAPLSAALPPALIGSSAGASLLRLCLELTEQVGVALEAGCRSTECVRRQVVVEEIRRAKTWVVLRPVELGCSEAWGWERGEDDEDGDARCSEVASKMETGAAHPVA
jgi:hypothetical protein